MHQNLMGIIWVTVRVRVGVRVRFRNRVRVRVRVRVMVGKLTKFDGMSRRYTEN